MPTQPIVLIDDDSAWSEATAALLQGEGFDVLTAGNGEHGLELILDNNPCLVILDAHLPRLGGLEVLRELHQAQQRSPVLMVSADDRSALINQAMDEGAAGFLRKPVSPPMLLRAIRRFVERVPAESTNALAPPS
ncbi:MAG TPA: response regulator [Gemmataceae bacterium]|nr:response regulator [Gemmataceae bacterium]